MWIKGYYRNIGNATNILAELWRIRDGLELACSLNISHLEVEIDCVDIISMIKSTENVYHYLHLSIMDCTIADSSSRSFGKLESPMPIVRP